MPEVVVTTNSAQEQIVDLTTVNTPEQTLNVNTSTFAQEQFLDFIPPPFLSSETVINQVGHGFVVGNVVRDTMMSGFVLAMADSPANAEVIGIVSVVVNANTFYL